MANYADVKAIIDTYIKRNGIKAITGNILNGVLTKMLTELGAGYQYGGMADPSTDPGTPDYNVVYLAATAGTYTNFDGILLGEGEIALLKYNGSWSKDTVGDFYSRDDIDSMLADYVRQEPGKGLSTNDYTDEDKAKLDGVEEGAQVNAIEGVSVNGYRLQPDLNKVVDVDVPTDLSELREDAEHRLVTDDQIAGWNAKYVKPAGGIPAEDLAQAVQDLLTLADSSLQPSAIVQEAGQQTGKVMSQKAVTDAVAAVDAEVSQLGQDVGEPIAFNRYVDDNGNWYNSNSYLIRIIPGANIIIDGVTQAYYTLLNTFSGVNNPLVFATGYTGRVAINASDFPKTIVAPNDAHYLFVRQANITSIKVEGYEFLEPTKPNDRFLQVARKVEDTIDVVEHIADDAILETDLQVIPGENLADKTKIVNGLVADGGVISASNTWQYIAIDVSQYAAGTKITFGGFYLGRSAYLVFHDAAGNKINEDRVGYYYAFSDPDGNAHPRTTTIPENAHTLYIDVKTNSSPANPYEYLQVNAGETLLPYTPYTEYITKIKEYEIAGGADTERRIENLEDDVDAIEQTLESSLAGNIIADLPLSVDGSDIDPGYAYINSTTGAVIVKQ